MQQRQLRMLLAVALASLQSACAVPTLKPRSAACTLVVLIAPVAGCESTPLASVQEDEQAKQFAPDAGMAQVYITRSSIVGSRNLWGVSVDGKVVGVLSLDTYVLQGVMPGPHRISVITGESLYTVEVSAAEGDNLFLEAVPKLGRTEARAELRALPPQVGRQRVLGARRVMVPPAAPTAPASAPQ